MLKSTEIKLKLLDKQNQLLEERNRIERDTSEVNRQLAQQQCDTRDRVDISLKEYNEMRERIAQLESDLNGTKQTLDKILKPFWDMKVAPEIIEEIVVKHNFTRCEVKTFENAIDDPLYSKIAIIYTVLKKGE